MKRRARDGFTLLELLLAISLLALITGAILGGLHIGRRAWETSRASESLDEIEGALRAVVSLFARSYPVAVAAQDAATGQVLFEGRPNVCRFIMLSAGGAQWGGLHIAEIGSEADSTNSNLAVWTSVFRDAKSADIEREAMTRTVILKELVSFRLSYFGVLEQGKPPTWTDAWSHLMTTPKLIAVTIAARRAGRVIEMSATVATRQQ